MNENEDIKEIDFGINKAGLVEAEMQQTASLIYVLELRLRGAEKGHNLPAAKQLREELARQTAYRDILKQEMATI